MFEFHVSGKDSSRLHQDIMAYDLSWSHKIYEAPDDHYMIGTGELILPYSYISVIQHYQSEKEDQMINQFFTKDYYWLKG